MGKKPTNWRLWGKVTIVGIIVGVGGPMFTAWISPSEEEIRAKYNPDLRKRSLEGKAAREQEFDEFVTKLKEYSKSDKPIWVVAREAEELDKKRAIEAAKAREREAADRRQEMRKEAGLDGGPGLNSQPAAAQTGGKISNGLSGWFGWR